MSRHLRQQEVLYLAKLSIRSDSVTEAAKIRNSTRLNKLCVSLRTVLFVPLVRHAEDIECLALHLRGVDALKAVLNVLVPGLDKEKFLSVIC